MQEDPEVRRAQEEPSAKGRRFSPGTRVRRLQVEGEGSQGDEGDDEEVERGEGEDEEEGGEKGERRCTPDGAVVAPGYGLTSRPRPAERYAASTTFISPTCSVGRGASASPPTARTKWSSCRR